MTPSATEDVRAWVAADWVLLGHYRLMREQPPLDPVTPPRGFRWSIVGFPRYPLYALAYAAGRAGLPPANDWAASVITPAWLAGVDDQALLGV